MNCSYTIHVFKYHQVLLYENTEIFKELYPLDRQQTLIRIAHKKKL